MTTTGSLQYAVEHLNVKVVVIMGHEGCGAVKAALSPLEDINKVRRKRERESVWGGGGGGDHPCSQGLYLNV
jgi:carbonic anhydrase